MASNFQLQLQPSYWHAFGTGRETETHWTRIESTRLDSTQLNWTGRDATRLEQDVVAVPRYKRDGVRLQFMVPQTTHSAQNEAGAVASAEAEAIADFWVIKSKPKRSPNPNDSLWCAYYDIWPMDTEHCSTQLFWCVLLVRVWVACGSLGMWNVKLACVCMCMGICIWVLSCNSLRWCRLLPTLKIWKFDLAVIKMWLCSHSEIAPKFSVRNWICHWNLDYLLDVVKRKHTKTI